MNTQINWPSLIVFILLCQAAGILGSAYTIKSIPTWYKGLIKPSFNPPSWLFGPVWTLLYTLMAISGYLLWQNPNSKLPVILFFVQLMLNAIWTPLFFGAKKLGWAFVELTFMWAAILLTIIFSWSVSPWAAYLLLPYLAWVSFAGTLNFYLWKLNQK